MAVLFFLCTRRENEGRRRRFRRREGDEAGGGGDSEDPVGEEDGYGAFCSHAQSEEIYHDLCSLHLPPPPSAVQVIIAIIIIIHIFIYFQLIDSIPFPTPFLHQHLFSKIQSSTSKKPKKKNNKLRYSYTHVCCNVTWRA